MRPEDPPQQAVAPQRVAQRLAVAGPGPELLPGADPSDRAAGPAPEDRRERVVEPDDRVDAPPGDLSYGAVAAVDDPALRRDRAFDPLAEDIVGHRRPSRRPVQ